MIEILVVEHPPTVRRTLTARLGIEPDLRVIDEADDQASAVRLARALQPHVVLLDAEMPNLDLRGTVKAICGVAASGIVILTMHPASVAEALAPAEAAVVGKHEGTAALLAAIRRAAGPDG